MAKTTTRKTTISLSPDEVAMYLRERYKEEFPPGSKITVNFQVRSHLEGYGMFETEVTQLESIDVVAES